MPVNRGKNKIRSCSFRGFGRMSAAYCLTAAVYCLLIACKPHIKTQAVDQDEKSAFYTISAFKDSVSNQTDFKVSSVVISDAKIKYSLNEAKTKEPYYLRIEITDAGKRRTEAITEHPLYKRVEIYSESGQIESKLISLPKGDVIFRIPYREAYKKIKITEVVNFKVAPPVVLKNEK